MHKIVFLPYNCFTNILHIIVTRDIYKYSQLFNIPRWLRLSIDVTIVYANLAIF